MATGDTEVRIILDAQGNPSIVKVNKSLDKQNKSLDKNTKKKKQGETQSKRNQAVEKSMYQTTLNSTKGFSKQARAMGGSSGLVAAYATLAANVFAATAAFGALQRAAQFEQLKKGLTELGHQSGRTLSIMASGLRDVTGGAISMEEAMRAAALGVSGGFGGEQLEGLAKIAKGASITLGRSLPDAFDRLTRGAIKLEPEILDELGIMVRLDDAVDNYATSIGKTGAQLTQMERRQAFMNEILTQGESKFGEIADAIEPDAYSRLAATFGDLTNSIFSFINTDIIFGFAGLNDVVTFLADNVLVLLGMMTLFASTIAGKMIPALASGAAGAQHMAEKAAHLANTTNTAKIAHVALMEQALNTSGAKVSDNYAKWSAGIANSKDKMGDLNKMQKSLNASVKFQEGIVKTGTKAQKKAAVDKIALLKLEQAQLKLTTQAELGRGAAGIAHANATALLTAEKEVAYHITRLTNKEQKMGATWAAIGKATENYTKDLTANSAALTSNNILVKLSAKGMIFLKGAMFKARKALGLLKISLIELLLPIAAMIIAIGLFWAIWDWKNNTKEQKAYNKGVEELDTLISELPTKVEKYNAAMNNSKNLADGQVRAFEIQSGILTEINDKLKSQVKLRQEADDKGGKRESLGMGNFLSFFRTSDEVVRKNTGDQLIKQFGFDEKFFDALLSSKKALRSVLSIQDSDELKAASAIMRSKIPGMADAMNEKLKKVLSKGGGAEEVAKGVFNAVGEVTNMFGNLGPAAKGLREALAESEKEGSKFLNTFTKKTSVDMFVKSTSAGVKAMREFEASIGDAKMALKETLGKTLLDIGPMIGSMMGGEFLYAQKELKNLTNELNALENRGLGEKDEEWKAKKKELDGQVVYLTKFSKQYKQLNTDLKKTQRLEMSIKNELKAMDKITKFISKNRKNILSFAGKEHKLAIQRLKVEKALADAKAKQLRTTFDEVVYSEKVGGKIVKKRLEGEIFIKLELKEQLRIAELAGRSAEHVFALRNSIFDELLAENEIKRQIATADRVERIEQLQYFKSELAIKKQINDAEQKNLELQKKITKFLRTGTTKLSETEMAKIKIDAARSAADIANKNFEIERSLIALRAGLQLKNIEFLNKELELQNKKAKLEDPAFKGKSMEEFMKSDSAIELIDIDVAEKQIKKMASLQTELLRQTTQNAGDAFTVAIMEGLEVFKDDVGTGSTLFEALEANKKATNELRGKGPGSLSEKQIQKAWKEEKSIIKITQSYLKTMADVLSKMEFGSAQHVVIDNFPEWKMKNINTPDNFTEEQLKAAQKLIDRTKTLTPEEMIKQQKRFSKENVAQFKVVEGGAPTGDMFSKQFPLQNLNQADLYKSGVTIVTQNAEVIADDVNTGLSSVGGPAAARLGHGPVQEKRIPQPGDEDFVGPMPPTVPQDPPPLEGWMLYNAMLRDLQTSMTDLSKIMVDFGPEGEAYSAMMDGMFGDGDNSLLNTMSKLVQGSGSSMEMLSNLSGVIGSIGSIMANSSKMAVAQIDNQIKAEKSRDGSSKESLDKIKQMENKKLAIQKKAFETKKKLAIAESMISITVAVLKAWDTYGWPWGAVLGAAIAAMGMKQISIIKSQQFDGGVTDKPASPGSITVGKRNNKVDVSKGAGSGELAYLRGERGIGSTANNFQPMNGAAGLRKGYADGGQIVVGERGPETITPLDAMQIWPSGPKQAASINANITINAVDAAGVEEVLMGQQGHIINMLRSAANENGEEFLESIDTQTYGNPQSAGGIDY